MLFLFRISQTVRESQSSSFAVILSEMSLKKPTKTKPDTADEKKAERCPNKYPQL